MKRLCGYDWDEDLHYTILVVSDEDVQAETSYKGFGFDVVILPKEFENTESDYITTLRMLVSIKKLGEIIYV